MRWTKLSSFISMMVIALSLSSVPLTSVAQESSKQLSRTTSRIPTLNADGSYNFDCTLRMRRYWDPDYTGPRRAVLYAQGSGWLPVNPAPMGDEIVQAFAAEGYMVFAPELRGWVLGGATGCAAADRAQQDRDYEAAFMSVLFNQWRYNLNDGIVLAGTSASAHRAMYFSRNANAYSKAHIRGVVTVDGVVSFWQYWANNNGFYTPGYFEPRSVTVPGANGDLSIDLVAGDGTLNMLLQGYYTDGIVEGLDCNTWYQVGADCFSANNANVWPFVLGNSPFSDDPSYPPVLMVSTVGDEVVFADAILGTCQMFGALSFVDDNADRYIADCGTGGEQFILRKAGHHAHVLHGVMADILDWVDAQR